MYINLFTYYDFWELYNPLIFATFKIFYRMNYLKSLANVLLDFKKYPDS